MDGPPGFIVGVAALSVLGALLPLDLGGGRKEYVVLTITATAQLAILGLPGLLIVWLAIVAGATAARMARQQFRSLLVTGAAISIGFGVACLLYLVVLGESFPLMVDTPGDGLLALAVLSSAWLGTMSVRAAAGHVQLRRAAGFDPFEAPLLPYVLPTVGGVPIVVAVVALYSEPSPWMALGTLYWTLPLYATCRFDLYQRRTGSRLRHEAEQQRVLAGIGAIASRVVHQTRHQAGLMGWSLHRLSRLVGDPSPQAVEEAQRELAALGTAKQRIQQTLDVDMAVAAGGGDAGRARGAPVGMLVAGVVDELVHKAAERGVSVEVTPTGQDSEPGPYVPASLHAAVFNLVDNALDAAASTVEVQIETETGDLTQSTVQITVADDGSGLPDGLATALQPFVTAKPHGTGMGLAIADAVVTELGGDLHYRRRYDRTFFTVTIPTAARATFPPRPQTRRS